MRKIASVKQPVEKSVGRDREALPEAVLTEGMPAGELDWTGPLAQAYTTLIVCVHF